MTDDNEFVFREGPSGLEFVGNFEGLYKANPDPWEQSGDASSYGVQQYYNHSRSQLMGALRRRAHGSTLRGLEIGCGHGHVTACLAEALSQTWKGIDISPTAVAQANKLYPRHDFFVGNIIDGLSVGIRFDVVVLGQILWYVMHQMDVVMENCHRLIVPNGLLVISQAFLTTEQRYCAEVANGFDGTVKLLLKYPKLFHLIETRYEDQLGLAHHDGLIILRKV